jgi:hypothetical protein
VKAGSGEKGGGVGLHVSAGAWRHRGDLSVGEDEDEDVIRLDGIDVEGEGEHEETDPHYKPWLDKLAVVAPSWKGARLHPAVQAPKHVGDVESTTKSINRMRLTPPPPRPS